ncbi:MAG: hypothetical protein IPL46_23655 [Saprospiraceae bacterium]|nr:hypothetical protein [Saprospiraceae bacterium]
MVLTAAITDSVLLNGTMMRMLESEQKLTSRVGHLPDTYNFLKSGYDSDKIVMEDIIFGSSEYIKDGLLPLTEWLGESSWSDRMIDILDDIWAHAEIGTTFGKIPSENVEVNGEMLQVLSRIYFMTDEAKYLEWAIRLGDYYLLGDHHPTRDVSSLRLRDHGCEIVSGLCELYAVVSSADAEKKVAYQPHIFEMLEKILEVGRNEDGLFYDVVNPQTGEIINSRVADNFGYNLNGFYTVYLLDSIVAYREAVIKALMNLNMHYRDFDWENGSADGYADAIEGTLNLYNRENVNDVEEWLDSEIQVMWSKQQEDGIIEGWHGDGNFARTTIMYCLWKSKGLTLKPWRADVAVAAEMDGDTLWIAVKADSSWKGRLIFDQLRHSTILNLPFDWPRINQFTEWFTIQTGREYQVQKMGGERLQNIYSGRLSDGLPLEIGEGVHYFRVYSDPGTD